MTNEISIHHGFHDTERAQAAALFWQAFAAKLGKVMGPPDRALGFFEKTLNPQFALCARDETGALLGMAGFQTKQGGLVHAGLTDVMRDYGPVGGLWRGLVLSVLERKTQPGVFQMDGIFVEASARGQGVGTALLHAILAEAGERNMAQVQLDVIDTNPRARALYERVGFHPVSEESTGIFRHVFGFSKATRMTCPLDQPPGQ